MISQFKVSDHAKFISVNKELCFARPNLIDLNPNQLHYYQFMVNLDRCFGSCITFNNPSGRICIPNKTENKNLNVFNMITRTNESRTLKKHISCNCRCKRDGKKCSVNQEWNNNKCHCECKNSITDCVCKSNYIWNTSTSDCEVAEYIENYAYMKSYDSVITYVEIIVVVAKSYNNISENVEPVLLIKKTKYKMDHYIFHTIVLVPISLLLLIIITINCYYIKHWLSK